MHRNSEFVKYRLGLAGVTQTEIARRSGEDVRTVNHVIAGKRNNRADVVLKEVARATGLKYGDLVEMYRLNSREAA